MNRHGLGLLCLLFVLLVNLACRIPFGDSPEIFQTSTPDFTGTAFFAAFLTPTLTQPPANTMTPTLESTLTPSATVTEMPAQSQTPVITPRNGVLVTAQFLSLPPVIDGELGDWNLVKYPASFVVYGASQWINGSDLSSEVMMGWNEFELFLAALVKDDIFTQTATGENIYLGDSLEILLDTDLESDLQVNRLSPDDFQLGISPGSPSPGLTPESFLWFPVSVEGPRNRVRVGAVKTAGGYQVEAAVPWNIFEITPQTGIPMGFVFSVSDNDLASQAAQQSMVSIAPGRRLTDPTTWGLIVLVK